MYGVGAVVAAAVAAALIILLRPVLLRYALARPNARSSHRVPTPQGGGIAVILAALPVAGLAQALFDGAASMPTFAVVAGTAFALALLGGVDDVRPLPPLPRLLVQIAAVAVAVAAIDPGRILPTEIPLGAERALMVLAGTWWVNLTNFMDGIDLITVCELVPLAATIALLALAGGVPPATGALAAALGGALVGFAPFNRPVARLFLGDVGSLPLGLLTGLLLLRLAEAGHLAAALLLPLYYLGDATLTLARRAVRGERFWEAHRSHWYQRALGHGFSVPSVDAHVLALNAALAGLAAATLAWPSVALPALGVGAALTAALLRRFGTKRSV